MPAPDIPTLLDYETAIEDAVAAYLSGLYSNLQVLTPRKPASEEPKLTTPRVEISLVHTGTGSALHDRLIDGREYESHKTGTLTIKASVRRNDSTQSIALARGQLRQALQPALLALTPTLLPYYEILDITEAGSSLGSEPDNDEIFTEVTWSIHWFILPEAWPIGGAITDNLGFAITDNSGNAMMTND